MTSATAADPAGRHRAPSRRAVRTGVPVAEAEGGARRRLPRAGLPPALSTRRRVVTHAIALAALLSTFGYLGWRIVASMPSGPALWTGIPFLVLELQGAVTLVLFVLSTWDTDPPPVPEQTGPPPSVTVLVATYNEHLDVLLPTVAACLAMEGPHETWVLDDGDRAEVAEMCAALGARYVTRPVHDHAKAGNLNSALRLVDSDLIAVFDADHVPEPDFLVKTTRYFADARVGLVQTPQDFYNTSSFEHLRAGSELHEESLFYRVIQPGKNRGGAAFWCGTNAVLRVRALRSIGGVATETLTEDFHTTMRLHQAGWRSVYHNEVLASGLAAGSPDAFYAQRRRWGRGAMQVLKVDNPLTAPHLTWGQRLGYAYSLSAWFDSWRTLGLALVPVAVVFTGLFPVAAPPGQFIALAGTSFVLQQAANVLLGRGFTRVRFALLFDVIRLPSNLAATIGLLVPGTGRFAVTAKGRTGDDRTRARVPRMILVLGGVILAAEVWAALSFLGWTPTPYRVSATTLVPLFWLGVTLGFVALAVRRIRDLSYATERREGHRFPADNAVRFGNAPGYLVDVSLGGAQVRLYGDGVPVGGTVDLEVTVPDRDEPIVFRAVVRSRSGAVHRVQFEGRQWAELAALSVTAFGAGATRWAVQPGTLRPDLVGATVGGSRRRRDVARPVAVSAAAPAPVPRPVSVDDTPTLVRPRVPWDVPTPVPSPVDDDVVVPMPVLPPVPTRAAQALNAALLQNA